MLSKKLNFNRNALLNSAVELEKLFIKYAHLSIDVADAYKRCKPLIDKVKAGQIDKPGIEKLDVTYFSPEFDLINYDDLYKKAADLNMYLEGWESEKEFNSYMEKLMEQDSNINPS